MTRDEARATELRPAAWIPFAFARVTVFPRIDPLLDAARLPPK